MNGTKHDTEAVDIDSQDASGRRALHGQIQAYGKERWRGLQVIMPE